MEYVYQLGKGGNILLGEDCIFVFIFSEAVFGEKCYEDLYVQGMEKGNICFFVVLRYL